MMRNWFILFTTTFTMTILILAMTTRLLNIQSFDIRHVVLVAILSALLAVFMNLPSRLKIESLFFTVLLDITFIFTVVFGTSVIIGLHQIDLANFIITLSLVIIIYIIITLIYLFILTKEAEDMNKKINDWRNKHADS